jgi:hypothetical protein
MLNGCNLGVVTEKIAIVIRILRTVKLAPRSFDDYLADTGISTGITDSR